jgi:hypothetical protein
VPHNLLRIGVHGRGLTTRRDDDRRTPILRAVRGSPDPAPRPAAGLRLDRETFGPANRRGQETRAQRETIRKTMRHATAGLVFWETAGARGACSMAATPASIVVTGRSTDPFLPVSPTPPLAAARTPAVKSPSWANRGRNKLPSRFPLRGSRSTGFYPARSGPTSTLNVHLLAGAGQLKPNFVSRQRRASEDRCHHPTKTWFNG